MISRFYSARRSSIKIFLFLALFSLFLSGCTQLVRTEQGLAQDFVSLSEQQTIGQTFVANYDGMTGIYFYLSPQNTGDGIISLHLQTETQASDDLAVSLNTLAVDSVKEPGYYGFFFPVQASSNQKYYYTFLEMTGSGNILVGKAGGDSYLNGALYKIGAPEDAQTAFQLSYSRPKVILGLGWEAITWGGILALGVFLFILPGWGMFSLLWKGWGGFRWPEKLGLSASLSLAIYPLLLLWTDLTGLHLGAIYAWLPPLAGLVMILWQNRKRFNHLKLPHLSRLKLPWAEVTFIGLLVLIIFTRFWSIRTLDVPMWGDSYQHTMIAQLLVDHGGLISSWQPYADMTTFTYHFGFHAAAAVFDWITQMDMPKAVLWVGQLLNLLAVIAIYPLATKVGRSQWAGVVAVLVAGLISTMPMYYVNWGRYTQLAGQVILPGAIFLTWVILEAASHEIESPELAEKSNWHKLRRRILFAPGQMALMWIVLGGLALTHYRVLIFAILFFVAFFILNVRKDTWLTLLARIFWIGIGAGLFFLPWFIHTFAGKITLTLVTQLSTPAEAVSTATQQYNAIGELSSYLPLWLWLILPFSIVWGLWRREKSVVLISLWSFLILLAANPQWLHLPGEGVLSNFAVFIAAYIPASLLAGYLLGQVSRVKLKIESARITLILALLTSGFIIAFGVFEARIRLRDLQVMQGSLVTRPDIQAAKWIQENTPQEARFLVNSFFAYGDTLIVGSDGGWWLPLLAHRQTTLPPINYSSEGVPRPDFLPWVNALTTEIKDKGIANPKVLSMLHARGVTYIYVGQRQGRVNYGGPYMLEPEQLLASPNFHLVYHQDRVWLFEILQ